MPISAWVTPLTTFLSDWRYETQSRPKGLVSLSQQYKRVVTSPLPIGLNVLGTGLQHPLGAVNQYSRVSKFVLKEKDLTPVLADEDGNAITTQAGEPIRIF